MTTKLWTRVTSTSFKTKATLVAIAVGIIPVILIGGLNYTQINNADRQQIVKTQTSRAGAIADKLNRFVFERNGDVEIISSLPVFTDAKTSAITSIQSKSQLLDRFVTSYQVYDSIAAFDIKGNLIAQTKGERLDNHFNRQYFQEVLNTGKTTISKPEISKSSKKLVIHFAAPIRDSITNKIIGIVRTRTPVERLAVPLKDFGTKFDNYYILDRLSNKVFISSNGQYRNEPETAIMAKARQNGGIIRQEKQANNSPQLLSAASFHKLEGMSELPWMAVVTIDEDAAYIGLQELFLTILAGAGATTILTIALSTFFADRVTKYFQRAIGTITTSANEIIDTVQSQEITVNQQANSAIATADTVNQLESISNETAAQATASATGAQQARILAEEGTQAVQQTLQGMSGLRDRVDEIAEQILNLGEQTKQITTVSDLVSALAKQTNMLALKAAVEAARVGEQGKGFGVVAGEIRKLAEESKKSAEKINNLATDIQTAINLTAIVTDRGTKTVTEGIQLAQNTAATFVGVTDAVNSVFLNSQQISASAKQQATAIGQVLGEMTIISQGSQESAVGMHRVKTFTRELNQIADELQAAVS